MKTYPIKTAQRLREAARLLKDAGNIARAERIATVWSAMERKKSIQKPMQVFILIGRSATLMRKSYGTNEIIGKLYLPAAREFIKNMEEKKDEAED